MSQSLLPTVVVDGTNPSTVSWFTGGASVPPNVPATVGGNGYNTQIVDLGDNVYHNTINLYAAIQSISVPAAVPSSTFTGSNTTTVDHTAVRDSGSWTFGAAGQTEAGTVNLTARLPCDAFSFGFSFAISDITTSVLWGAQNIGPSTEIVGVGAPANAVLVQIGTSGGATQITLHAASGSPATLVPSFNVFSGNQVNAVFTYSGGVLTIQLTDSVTLSTWTGAFTLDIVNILGASQTTYPETTAWFGVGASSAPTTSTLAWVGYATWSQLAPGGYRLYIDTSDDALTWRQALQSPLLKEADIIMAFVTKRRYFRLRWWQDPPNGNGGGVNGFAPSSAVDYFAPGQYSVAYIYGAYAVASSGGGGSAPLSFSPDQPWFVNPDQPFAGGGGEVTYSWQAASNVVNNRSTPEGYAAPVTGFASEQAVESYYAGYTLAFEHEGGQIGLQSAASGAYNGLSGPVWVLESGAQMTFVWGYTAAD